MTSSLVTIKKASLVQQHAQQPYFREFSGEWELRKSRWGVPICHLWCLLRERVMGPKGEGSVSLNCSDYQGVTDGKSWCLWRSKSMREEIGEERYLFPRIWKDGFEDRYGVCSFPPKLNYWTAYWCPENSDPWVLWKLKQSLRAVL